MPADGNIQEKYTINNIEDLASRLSTARLTISGNNFILGRNEGVKSYSDLLDVLRVMNAAAVGRSRENEATDAQLDQDIDGIRRERERLEEERARFIDEEYEREMQRRSTEEYIQQEQERQRANEQQIREADNRARTMRRQLNQLPQPDESMSAEDYVQMYNELTEKAAQLYEDAMTYQATPEFMEAERSRNNIIRNMIDMVDAVKRANAAGVHANEDYDFTEMIEASSQNSENLGKISSFFNDIINAYTNLYAERTKETLESEKTYRKLAGRETAEDIKEGLAADEIDGQLADLDRQEEELKATKDELAKANKNIETFVEENNKRDHIMTEVIRAGRELFAEDEFTKELKENLKYKILNDAIEQMRVIETNKAREDMEKAAAELEEDEEKKKEARDYAKERAALTVNSVVSQFKSSDYPEKLLGEAEGALDAFVMNYVMRNLENSLKNNEEFIEKGFDAVKDNKTWMESIKEDAKKIGEDAANTLLNKGGNIVISDLLAASLEPLSQKIDEAREKSKESMLKSMKEVKKFREEIEAMEKEAPIEYGTYEVEVKEAPPMFGERENALARDRFNSDEEYLNALTAALEEKEAIIADNDKLKAEMEADLARLEQKANKHHEIEYTIGQRYEEIDHKYSYINDYDSSKKFKELIDLDRAFSNVPYVLGNNNKIRENERKMKERDANRALLTEEIEKLKAENKKYIEDFDKKAAYVENNIKTKGGFVGMPSTKIVGKKCTMQEINDMAYFRNHLEEYVESAQNMKKLLEDEQKKRIKNYTDNPLIKKGPQIINSLGFYSKEKEIRTNYKEFLTLVMDAIDKEKEEPGAFDKLINSDSFTVKGLISDSKVEITDTMRVIARNARDFEEVRDVIAKKGTLDNLVDNEFVTLQDDLTGDDGLNYLGTLLDNSIRDAKEKIIKRLGDKLDAEIDEMRKYIVSVNDYFNAAVGKEMKAYDQTQNAINMEKQHEQQLYKDLLDKASLDRQYALAYDDIDKKLTEGIEETSKNLKEETLAIKKEIENVKLNMAKAQLIKDVDDAYNIAKGKEPFVIGLDRVNFGKSYSDSGAPLSEGLSRESLLTNMVGDTSASSQKIIDSVYINGITAREYYKGAHSGENLTDDQIKEELGKDMMLLANNAYGIDIKNRSQLEGNVISVKEDGVMRAVIFDNVFTKDIDNLKAPAKPSEPSKWFKSQEKYENQLIEYRSKMDAYEQEKKEYDFYARFAKKGTAEYDFYKSAADRIAKSNSFAEQMCRNMNTMTESEIQERINKNSVLFADANENAKQYKDVNPVVRRGISELTKVSSTGRKNVSPEHKTQPNVHKEAADKGIQPK